MVPREFAVRLVFLCAANAAWCVGVERALRAAFPARSRALLPPPLAASDADAAATGEEIPLPPSSSRKSRAQKKDE